MYPRGPPETRGTTVTGDKTNFQHYNHYLPVARHYITPTALGTNEILIKRMCFTQTKGHHHHRRRPRRDQDSIQPLRSL